MKKIILLFLLVLFTIPNEGRAEEVSKIQIDKMNIPKMDTSNWITHPVGRYLIKLPPTAQIKWSPLSFASRYKIQWEKELSYEQALTKLQEKIKDVEEEIKKKVDCNDDYWMIQPTSYALQYSPLKYGTLLTVRHDNADYDNLTHDIIIKNNSDSNSRFMDSELSKRIYSFKKGFDYLQTIDEMEGFVYSPMQGEREETENTQHLIDEFIQYISDNISPYDSSMPLANTSGIYFEGGFIADPTGNIAYPKTEGIGLEISFSDRHGLYLTISFSNDGGYRTHPQYDTTIAGMQAEEGFSNPIYDDQQYYSFLATTRSVGYDIEQYFEKAYITMHLDYPYISNRFAYLPSEVQKEFWDNVEKTPAFSSDEEAIAFWNAIKENIRFRPDGVHVPLPEEAKGKPYFIVYDKIVPSE